MNFTISQLSEMPIPELQEIAQKLNISNFENLGKQELMGNIILKQKANKADATATSDAEASTEKKKRGRKKKSDTDETVEETTIAEITTPVPELQETTNEEEKSEEQTEEELHEERKRKRLQQKEELKKEEHKKEEHKPKPQPNVHARPNHEKKEVNGNTQNNNGNEIIIIPRTNRERIAEQSKTIISKIRIVRIQIKTQIKIKRKKSKLPPYMNSMIISSIKGCLN